VGSVDGELERLILGAVSDWEAVLNGPRPPIGPGVQQVPVGPNFF
jgi:hypothetical protein